MTYLNNIKPQARKQYLSYVLLGIQIVLIVGGFPLVVTPHGTGSTIAGATIISLVIVMLGFCGIYVNREGEGVVFPFIFLIIMIPALVVLYFVAMEFSTFGFSLFQ